MRTPLRLMLLLSLGACRVPDNGTGCPLDGAAYAGFVALGRISYPESGGAGEPNLSFVGSAVVFPQSDAGAIQQFFTGCGLTELGQCCYVPPAADAGADSAPSFDVSDWNVTVINKSDPDSGVAYEDEVLADGGPPIPEGETDPLGSLIFVPWTGGDELVVQGKGSGNLGTFSGSIVTAMDFKGLDPALFADAGVVQVNQPLALTWTPGGSPSVLIAVFDEMTSGQVSCAVADNGSFEIPGALLSNFAPGDQGGLLLARSAQACAYSDSASISLIAQTSTVVGVTFQ